MIPIVAKFEFISVFNLSVCVAFREGKAGSNVAVAKVEEGRSHWISHLPDDCATN